MELQDLDREVASGTAAGDEAAAAAAAAGWLPEGGSGEDDRGGLMQQSGAESGSGSDRGNDGAATADDSSPGFVVAVHVAKLGQLVPRVLRLMTSLVPLLSSDAALRTLLADNKLLLRLLVDIPLRALQRRSQDTPGARPAPLSMPPRRHARLLVDARCLLAIGPQGARRELHLRRAGVLCADHDRWETRSVPTVAPRRNISAPKKVAYPETRPWWQGWEARAL